MNDLGPPPDWDGIFDRAHRRVAGRLLLVGAVGAFCALLLLGGGLSAQGAVSLGIGGHTAKPASSKAAMKAKAKSRKRHRQRKKAAKHRRTARKIHRKTSKKTHEHNGKHHPMWNPCAGKSLSSVEQQYCEGVEDGNATGEPGAGTSTTVEPADGTGDSHQPAPSKTTETPPTG
ncbi:MAG TPA: hypothetical protein VLK56_07105 [Solirubrobacterales bacterium]|nr:hypothetical protein [Solirubrobacterales bacterium]